MVMSKAAAAAEPNNMDSAAKALEAKEKFKEAVHAEGKSAATDLMNANEAISKAKSGTPAETPKVSSPGSPVKMAIMHEGVELTHGELSAIHGYTNGEYSELNAALRQGTSLSSSHATLAANLDTALDKGSLKGGTYFRGIDGHVATKMFGPEINIGDTITDKGFISTSKSQATAHSFSHGGVVLEISVDHGSKGMDVEAISSVGQGEHEVILPRNSKFTITGVKTPTSNAAQLVVKIKYGGK
jgi:hypothetical protein